MPQAIDNLEEWIRLTTEERDRLVQSHDLLVELRDCYQQHNDTSGVDSTNNQINILNAQIQNLDAKLAGANTVLTRLSDALGDERLTFDEYQSVANDMRRAQTDYSIAFAQQKLTETRTDMITLDVTTQTQIQTCLGTITP